MTEAEKRLAEVRAAISQILENGQSVRKGDREVRRAITDCPYERLRPAKAHRG